MSPWGSAANKPCGDADTSCLGPVLSEKTRGAFAAGAALHSMSDSDDEDLSVLCSLVCEVCGATDAVAACSLYSLNPIDPDLSLCAFGTGACHALLVIDSG